MFLWKRTMSQQPKHVKCRASFWAWIMLVAPEDLMFFRPFRYQSFLKKKKKKTRIQKLELNQWLIDSAQLFSVVHFTWSTRTNEAMTNTFTNTNKQTDQRLSKSHWRDASSFFFGFITLILSKEDDTSNVLLATLYKLPSRRHFCLLAWQVLSRWGRVQGSRIL